MRAEIFQPIRRYSFESFILHAQSTTVLRLQP
jgi:hypothetical protein